MGALARRLASSQAQSEPASAFARDEAAAALALGRLNPGQDRLVAFVGKLIVSKGVDLLMAAWPLVLEEVPRARLVVVGFGAYRQGLERLTAALSAGDIEQAREIALAGRTLEVPASEADRHPARPAHPLGICWRSSTASTGQALERYLRAAARIGRGRGADRPP